MVAQVVTLASARLDFGIRPTRGYRSMDTRIFLPILFAVLVLFAIAALLILRKRKSDQLKQRFGPEYDRVVQQHGGTRPAEAVLAERERSESRSSPFTLCPQAIERDTRTSGPEYKDASSMTHPWRSQKQTS